MVLFFKEKSDVHRFIERSVQGVTLLDNAELAELVENIEEKGPDGYADAAKALKYFLKNTTGEEQNRTIRITGLLLNSRPNFDKILDKEYGLGAQLIHLAEKGEPRSKFLARELLNLWKLDDDKTLREVSDQVKYKKAGHHEPGQFESTKIGAINPLTDRDPHFEETPGDFQPVKSHRGHRIRDEEIATPEQVLTVGYNILDHLRNSEGPEDTLVANAKDVRHRALNLIYEDNNKTHAQELLELNDQLLAQLPK